MPRCRSARAPVHGIAAVRPVGSDPLDQRRALLCLTQAVYYEAGFEPIEGRRAVAQVVINRMRHPAFPKSVCGVVYQGARDPGLPVQLRLRRLAVTAVRRSAPGRRPRRIAARGARRLRRAVGRRRDPLSRRLCRALLGAAAGQDRADRRAYLLPLAGRWGSTAAFTGRYIGEPNDPAVAAPDRCARRSLTDGTIVPVDDPALAGPPIARAENDVGGLLDTSKGWTLNIPMPSDTSSRRTKAIAEQQAADRKTAAAAPRR